LITFAVLATVVSKNNVIGSSITPVQAKHAAGRVAQAKNTTNTSSQTVLSRSGQIIKVTKRQDDCSGYFDELSGTFNSPGYPGDYPNNAVCSWEIEAPPEYRIRLTFPDFRLEPSSNCEKDFVEVYDGKDFRQ
jgi:cubilin